MEIETEEEGQLPPTFSLRLEAQSHAIDTKQKKSNVSVEGITILSSTVEGNSIILDTEVIVRSSSKLDLKSKGKQVPKPGVVKTRLNVAAVLANRSIPQRPVASGLVALELGGGSRPLSGMAKNLSMLHAKHTKLGPLSVELSLTSALCLSATSVDGPSNGNTMVSLTMQHSNTHSEPVTVTNIALHPGHSRQDSLSLTNKSMPGGSVVDMSNRVKWGYVPQTAPELPLTLQPFEAFSIILNIQATDIASSKTYASPVSVTAVVGQDSLTSRRPQSVVTTDAQWTTGRVAIEPSNAFRIELSLRESTCQVGAPFSVNCRVENLAEETRDLLLVMPKGGNENEDYDEDDDVNPPVVSDANGYSFGVWGLSSGDDKDALSFSKDELLAMDAAIMLGEVKGQQSVNAEIRFVPLKEGPLRIPDFKLYDKRDEEWYSCAHKLCVVASSDGAKD